MRAASGFPEANLQPILPNQAWSADFMSDALYTGIKYRTFNVLDDYNREALRIEIDVSLTSQRVIRVLEQVIAVRGRPEWIRLDNGPELTSAAFVAWAKAEGTAIEFITPGKPSRNGYIERFNGIYCEAVLDAWMFTNIDQVHEATEQGLIEYNLKRPHESLGGATPIEFLTRHGHAEVSIYARPKKREVDKPETPWGDRDSCGIAALIALFIARFIIGKASIPTMTISIDNIDLGIRVERIDMTTSL